MMNKTTKKAVSTTTAQTAKAPKEGYTMKNKKKMTVCQLKRIFKGFSKDILLEWNRNQKELLKQNLDRSPELTDLHKRDFEEMTKYGEDSYLEQLELIENGETEKLLTHLGVIQNGKLKIDNLKTALRTIRLLIDHAQNLNDLLFVLPGWELRLDQVKRLERLIRGDC